MTLVDNYETERLMQQVALGWSRRQGVEETLACGATLGKFAPSGLQFDRCFGLYLIRRCDFSRRTYSKRRKRSPILRSETSRQ